MNYDDLVGKVTHRGVTTLNGKEKPEPVLYLITDVDDDGMLVGVCLNEEAALHGLMGGLDERDFNRPNR